MRWDRANDWHWVRSCGRYSVNRELAFRDAKDLGRWVWRAWFKPSAEAMAEMISTVPLDSREAAIAVCTDHLKSQQRQVTAA